MPTAVSVGKIVVGSASNGVGIFSGQNMQNNWDSHAPNTSSMGAIMGNGCVTWLFVTYLQNENLIGQPLLDQDYKSNHSPMWIGP